MHVEKIMPNHNDKLLLQILEISLSVIYLILSLLSWGHNGVIIMKMVNIKLHNRNKSVTIIIASCYYYSNNCAGAAVIIVRPVKRSLV